MLEAERREQILTALLGVPEMTLDELVSATGIEKGLAFDAVYYLKGRGLVDAREVRAMGGVRDFVAIRLLSAGREAAEKLAATKPVGDDKRLAKGFREIRAWVAESQRKDEPPPTWDAIAEKLKRAERR